jgi:hypothetical protein
MSKFIGYFSASLVGSAVVAFATASNIHQFYNITLLALFSTLLVAVAGVAVYELLRKRPGEPT